MNFDFDKNSVLLSVCLFVCLRVCQFVRSFLGRLRV